MAVSERLFSYLWSSGFVTSTLLFDVGIFIVVSYTAWNIVKPAYKRYRTVAYLEEAAGASKRHWFFGHSKEFSANQDGLLKRSQVTSTHPTMIQHWLAPFITVINLHHSDVAISLLSSGAPKNELTYGFLRPWLGDGLLTSKGKKWHRNRHLLTPAFHFNVLKGYAKIANESSKIMLDKWEENALRSFDVTEHVSLMTLDTMLRCAMSSNTDCQNVREGHPYIKAVKEIAQSIMTRITKPYLFPDFIFWRTSIGKRFKQALHVVHSHTEQIIEERKTALNNFKQAKKSSNSNDEDFISTSKQTLDFLDILVQTRDEDGNGLTDREIRDEVDTFLFEGHDTTSSGISWAIYNLAKHPSIQEKCREEGKDILGEKDYVEWNDLSKFTYLTMFIKESMRLYPPVFAIGRQLERPMTLRSKLNKLYETVVPNGMYACLHIFSLHRNELIWERPLEFDPERFTKENIAKRSPHAYVPFSAGSRNCIGQNFAMNEMKIALAQTLQRYRLYLDEETPEPIMEPRLVLQSKDGIHVKIERIKP